MKSFTLLLAFVFTLLDTFAQKPIQYSISFPNAVHHEAQVRISISQVPPEPLVVKMSRSSPGRYATHEFGKNIYNVKALNSKGIALKINQIAGDVYQIPMPDSLVKISYTVFGNWVDGTYLAIDETHAHINMPATFMWVKGMDNREIEITFNDLSKYEWRVATQLKSSKDSNKFSAPNLQYFMDSPTELSTFKTFTWTDTNPDTTVQTLHLSVHSSDDQAVVDNYGNMIQRVVTEAKAVYGELARFDYGVYTFLQDINPENAGDGMEHRNSTIITSGADKIEGNETDLLGTISHEFFHSWNVERIRPKSLEPFNFEHANMSNELWLAEGFTQYYGPLILKRASFKTLKDYCNTLSQALNSVLNSPGAQKFPAIQMSRYAVFADAGIAIDQNNNANIFTSYYNYGAVIAIALDLRLRSEFNKTLDQYMQALWKAHGKVPYTNQDLENNLAKLTNPSYAHDFFKRYIYGTEKNNYAKLLAKAGLILRKAMPEKASLGPLKMELDHEKVKITSSTIEGTSAYDAGLDKGDYLLKIGDEEIKAVSDIKRLLESHKPNDEVSIQFEHRGIIKISKIKLKENNILEVIPDENATEAQTLFQTNWLSSKIK